MNVAVIGLGFVGLTLSLSLADRGLKVYGVEINPETYNKIKNRIPTINEFGIKEIHLWSYKKLLDRLPNKSWLIKHNPKELEGSIIKQITT